MAQGWRQALDHRNGKHPMKASNRMRATERLSTRWRTSDDAFVAAPKGAATKIFNTIQEQGPLTCDEIMAMGMSHSTASAAINKLMRTGHIRDLGCTRKTRAGRDAVVWFQYSDRPVPIADKPTRAELAARIQFTIGAIRAGTLDPQRLIDLLEGKNYG